jgi:hypothetical protein
MDGWMIVDSLVEMGLLCIHQPTDLRDMPEPKVVNRDTCLQSLVPCQEPAFLSSTVLSCSGDGRLHSGLSGRHQR